MRKTALSKIQSGHDRVCELYFSQLDRERTNPLGVVVYKRRTSDELSHFGLRSAIEIKTLFVFESKDNSRKGIGSALLARVLAYAHSVHARSITVTVSDRKPEVFNFFSKYKFSVKAKLHGKYEAEINEALMGRTLNYHTIPLYAKYLSEIRRGTKSFEGRINSGPFLRIYEGDIASFTSKHEAPVTVEVTEANKFGTFREMLIHGGVQNFLPEVKDLETAVDIYHKIPGYHEKETKFGVVGFKLKILPDVWAPSSSSSSDRRSPSESVSSERRLSLTPPRDWKAASDFREHDTQRHQSQSSSFSCQDRNGPSSRHGDLHSRHFNRSGQNSNRGPSFSRSLDVQFEFTNSRDKRQHQRPEPPSMDAPFDRRKDNDVHDRPLKKSRSDTDR